MINADKPQSLQDGPSAAGHVPDDASDVFSTIDALADLHQAFGDDTTDREDERHYLDDVDFGDIDLALFKQALSPSRILLRDKLTFVFGSAQLWLIAYWLGASPSTFHLLYTCEALALFALRWAIYRSKGWHYYLYDFCYYANLLLLLHLWLLPRAAWLNHIVHAYSTGPLSWSTLTFRNSLVYHDLDKTTSVMLHLGPALVAWVLRWHMPQGFGPPDVGEQWDSSEQWQQWHQPGMLALVVRPLALYLLWATAYYLKVFVVSADKIRRGGYQTLFSYVTAARQGPFHAISRRVPPARQPLVYLALHLTFCLATFVVAIAAWRSWLVHTLLLATMGAISMWNGASYYFEVFVHRYLSSVGLAGHSRSEPGTPRGKRKAA